MNRKKLPLFLMLLAGSITSIMTFMLDYSMKDTGVGNGDTLLIMKLFQ